VGIFTCSAGLQKKRISVIPEEQSTSGELINSGDLATQAETQNPFLLVRVSIEENRFQLSDVKSKSMSVANHGGHRRSHEPIKTGSKDKELTQSAGKRQRASHDWQISFTCNWLCKWREIFKSIVLGSEAKQCEIRVKTALLVIVYTVTLIITPLSTKLIMLYIII